jgi:hypothetical protein
MGLIVGINVLSEGEEAKSRCTEEYDTERNTYYSYTTYNSGEEACKTAPKTEEDEPKKIANCFHSFSPKYNLISIFYTIIFILSMFFGYLIIFFD